MATHFGVRFPHVLSALAAQKMVKPNMNSLNFVWKTPVINEFQIATEQTSYR